LSRRIRTVDAGLPRLFQLVFDERFRARLAAGKGIPNAGDQPCLEIVQHDFGMGIEQSGDGGGRRGVLAEQQVGV
jgi:hypothetical protein